MDNVVTGVSTHCFSAFTPESHLPLLAAHDIRLVELGCVLYDELLDDRWFRNLRRVLDDCGIAVNSVHMPYPGDVNLDISDTDPAHRAVAVDVAVECIGRLAELNGRFLVLHPSCDGIADADRDGRLAAAAESLRIMAERISRHTDIRIAIETMPRAFLCRDSAESLDLLRRADAPAVGLCLDVNHMNFREDILAAVSTLAPHSVTTHLSDNDGKGERHWLPGRGVFPWPQLIDTLVTSGYAGPFIYETGIVGQTPAEAIAALAGSIRELFSGNKQDNP